MNYGKWLSHSTVTKTQKGLNIILLNQISPFSPNKLTDILFLENISLQLFCPVGTVVITKGLKYIRNG